MSRPTKYFLIGLGLAIAWAIGYYNGSGGKDGARIYSMLLKKQNSARSQFDAPTRMFTINESGDRKISFLYLTDSTALVSESSGSVQLVTAHFTGIPEYLDRTGDVVDKVLAGHVRALWVLPEGVVFGHGTSPTTDPVDPKEPFNNELLRRLWFTIDLNRKDTRIYDAKAEFLTRYPGLELLDEKFWPSPEFFLWFHGEAKHVRHDKEQ